MRNVITILVLLVSLSAGAYLAWAWHRISPGTLVDDATAWPRAWPYPDLYLLALNDWYDARYPAAPGIMKMHGELMRVRMTVAGAFATAASVSVIASLVFAWPWIRRVKRGRGFEPSVPSEEPRPRL